MEKNNPRELLYKDGSPMREYTSKIIEELMNEDKKQTDESFQTAVSSPLLSDVDYWKQRCLLAERCLEETPCDSDITSEQITAWNTYHKFISWAGNER